MARLPVVGDDEGAWGDLLNEFLEVSHDTDGTLINTPAGDISATTVQGAINELDSEKAATADLLSPDDVTLEESGTTLRIRQPITTYLDIAEMTAPSNPSANTARLFVRDNGGKTELCVIFPSGSIMQIKIEA